nr:MAG TPA: SMODS and SLOG-associating 2TM effector domain 6 [Bacteriophage sp.]
MYHFAECDIISLPFFLIGGGSFLVGVTALFIL